MARFLPAAPPAERPRLARGLAVRLGLVRLAWAGLLALAAAVASAVDPDAVPPATVALSSLALLCSVVATVLLQASLGLGRAGPWVARYPLENFVIVVAALALEPALGPTGAVAALPIATAASLLLGLVAAGGELGRAGASASAPAPMLRFARLQAAAGALTQLGLRGAIPVVALLGTAAETADAALAIGVGVAGLFGFLQLFVVLLPGAVRAAARAGTAGPERQLGRLAARCTLVAMPVAAVLAATAEPIVATVFGPAYAGAADALRIAFAVVAVAPLWSWLSQLAVLRLRPEAQVRAAAAGAAAFCLLVAPAVTAAGAAGAAAVTLASISISAFVLALVLAAGRRPLPA
ncbi:MAG: hypothetical protein KJ006_06580 [Thermoleophilia bacterium]|nr:hypothetical protein [Thermoleophilia bacterium]GIK76473.1 MAG: hypothetical protein BroJett022_01630 [Actinomycetes bacterium]